MKTTLALVLAALTLSCSSAPTATPPSPPAAAPATVPAPATGKWDHDWARGAVFYEVFVRSFADSNGDGVGDFRGLTGKLDYLNDGNPATDTDLGVDALWLMPVFESPSYHGYDVVDYEKIDSEYGTAEDFQRFLDEARRRGLRVIVDYVINHSGAGHPWFVEAAASPSSPRRSWYVWRADDPGWRQPWGSGPTWHRNDKDGTYYYGIFWGGMPDLNWGTPAVREEMERVGASWLARGLDGFRLDATRYLVANGPGEGQSDQPETHAFLKAFAERMRREKPQAILVAENWTDTEKIAPYFNDLPMNFNFPLAEEILRAVRDDEAAGIAGKLEEMADLYPPGAIDAPFLTNHDQQRLATQLGNDPAALRSAAAILLTLPGAPFLYYGEEVGLQNGNGSGDELKRTPMPWDATPGGGFTTGRPWFRFAPGQETANVAAQTGDAGSLLSHYRRLIRARKSSPALLKGDLKLLSPGNRSTPVLAFLRETAGERVLVVHNVTGKEAEAGPYAVEAAQLEPLFGTGTATRGDQGWTVKVPAGESVVWRAR
ncbi:MAG TPA: alpha-amylase family glycosyl hydrolase [Thermoanaerobaculia bacterium]